MKLMYLSTVLLVCLFILCAARTIETPLKLLNLDISRVAALSILLLFAGRFTFSPIQEISFNLGGALFLLITFICALNSDEGVLRSLGLSVLAAFVMLAVVYNGINERGLAMAVICMPFFLLCAPGEAFFTAAAAPIIVRLFVSAIDLYLYGYTVLDTGVAEIFDAQISAAYIAGATLAAFGREGKTVRD